MGMGTLTKIQTIIVIPILLTWIFIFSESESFVQTLKRALRLVVPFCVVALITFYLLWPWLWPNPPYRTFNWLHNVFTVAAGGHPMFYLGSPVGDPGWSFYPVVLIFQLTGPEFIGIFLFLFFLLRDRTPGHLRKKRKEILAVFSWITLYILFMSLIPTKLGVRYILAVFPAVLIVSSLGWISLIERIARLGLYRPKKLRVRPVQILFTIALLGVQAYPLVTEVPDYYYDYFNPLLGGGKTAARVLQIGWGEGLNEIAQYFHAKNEKASKEHTILVIGYHYIFNRYYKGPPAPASFPWAGEISLEYVLENYDYVVFQLNYVQRRWQEDIWIYFSDFTPEFTFRAYDLTLFWIFPVSPPP